MLFFHNLLNLILISAPYLLFGLTIAGVLEAFLSKEKLLKLLPAGRWGVVKASLVGIPLPLCSCSVLPAAITLKKNGAGNGTTSSFLISTPETGVDSIMLTYGLMGLPMAILRPVVAFIIAVSAGFMQLIFNKDSESVEMQSDTPSCCCKNGGEVKVETVKERVMRGLRFSFLTIFEDIALWMSIGLILGALLETFLPLDLFLQMGDSQSKLFVMLLGIPLYVCASASTPIALALVSKGATLGTAMIFLIVGPATNITNLMVMQKFIGKKGVVINIVTLMILSFIFSYIIDFALPMLESSLGVSVMPETHVHHTPLTFFWGGIFVLLLLRGLFIDLKSRFKIFQ